MKTEIYHTVGIENSQKDAKEIFLTHKYMTLIFLVRYRHLILKWWVKSYVYTNDLFENRICDKIA
jgi:hypothetical protein